MAKPALKIIKSKELARRGAETPAAGETLPAVANASAGRLLTREQFQGLAQLPPEIEWFANIDNPRTRRAYQHDLKDFAGFLGVEQPEEFRVVTRAHVIAWRDDLKRRKLSPTSIRRKLSALSSIFDYLCDKNAVPHNPVKGVARPKEQTNEGKTPALNADQARRLLNAPPERAIGPQVAQARRNKLGMKKQVIDGSVKEVRCWSGVSMGSLYSCNAPEVVLYMWL